MLDEPIAIGSRAIDRYLRHTGKVVVDDLDWEGAKRVGLTDDEVFLLTYFSDIEGQTLRNLGKLLAMNAAYEPAMTAFLTTWNYEEFFHGRALIKLLAVTGHPVASARDEQVSRGARASEWLERRFGPLVAHLFEAEFPAVHMTFGAIHELTTLRGYEQIAASTSNPALRALSERIARQERRHFAWYFNQARARLTGARKAQLLTRAVMRLHWVPVGAGVKRDSEVLRLFRILFPGALGAAVCAEIDAKIGSLPGLGKIALMRRYFARELAIRPSARDTPQARTLVPFAVEQNGAH